MKLRLINTYEHNPWYNLAVEGAALEEIGQDEILLYLWQNQHSVVIGRGQNPWRECRVQLLDRDGALLARRCSGGGAVYHDLGNLNYSFIAPHNHYDLEKQLAVMLEACRAGGIAATRSGRNDILAEGGKFSGSAFRKTSRGVLHHGTLMVRVDMAKLSRYLTPPQAKLQSKGVESVRSRVCNLSEFNPKLDVAAMRGLMEEAFRGEYGGEVQRESLADWQTDSHKRIGELYLQYASWQWCYGNTMNFNVSLEKRFGWGSMALDLRLARGRVEDLYVNTDAMDGELSAYIREALLGCHYGREVVESLGARSRILPEGESRECLKEVADWLEESM